VCYCSDYNISESWSQNTIFFQAIFKSPGAIRGGIPICFPQFGTHGNLEKHGFARNRLWSIDDNPPPLPVNTAIKTFADLILKPSEEDLKIWPHRFMFNHPEIMFHSFYPCCKYLVLLLTCIWATMVCSFEFRLRVALGPKGDLLVTSRIRNTNADGRPFSFTFAYHTYLSVSDIRYVYALQFLFLPSLIFFHLQIF
jgi:glucose-6-phosphate 1-epimerase